jgi:putative ABC transport system permease protein
MIFQNLSEVSIIGVLWRRGYRLPLGLKLIGKLYQGQHLVHLDGTMLLTAVILAVGASVIAGLYPIWRAANLAPAGLLKTQ